MQIFLSKLKIIMVFLILSIIWACGAGEDDTPTLPQEPDSTDTQDPTVQPGTDDKSPNQPQQFGTVSGRVTDAITKNPIPGVVVTLFDIEVETEVDGGFVFNDIPYDEEQVLVVSDALYEPYSTQVVLNEIRLVNNVALSPLNDHEEELNSLLDNLSDYLESLDMDNLPSLQSLFSDTYVAADDPITNIGVISGVVPPNYEGVIPTFMNVFEQYSWLGFTYDNLEYDITHARKASVQLLMGVDSEDADDMNLRILEGRCQFDFRREGGDWKIVYWKLMNLDIKL